MFLYGEKSTKHEFQIMKLYRILSMSDIRKLHIHCILFTENNNSTCPKFNITTLPPLTQNGQMFLF